MNSNWNESSVPADSILLRIERLILADLHPVRPLPPARYLSTAFLAIFAFIVAAGIYCKGTLALQAMSLIQSGVILSIMAIGAALLSWSLAKQMVPCLSPNWLPVGILLSLMLAVPILFPFVPEPHFWRSAWGCLRGGLLIGVPAAAPLWLVLRRGAILFPRTTGAATGLLAGLAGTAVAGIHCPNLEAWHVLVSHLGISVACATAGLAVGLGANHVAQASACIRRLRRTPNRARQ